jgi:hypothetical protein
VWSKKQDYNKGKVSYSKNLGSAQSYLSKVGDDDGTNKFIPVKDEKITYINEEEEKRERVDKDKSSINYNYQDFLSQFQNLSE